jgi:hypothetical protein
MTDNLKPCPFCNSDPKLEGDDHWWYAVCRCGADGGADQTAKKAIEIWNTRPIEDALRAQLAEAQAEVDRLEKELVLHNSKPLRNKPIEGKVYIGEHDPNIIVRFGDNEEYPDGVWCSE